MATLNALKKALKKVSDEAPRKPLNDEEYDDGLSLFAQASGEQTYQKTFIIPQLSELIASLTARDEISVLEIGPGPENVLGHLPAILRKRITKYVALEPSFQYTQSLTRWLSPMEDERPLPSLKHSLVRPAPFTPESCKGQNYDVILFCHSLYGMKRKEKIIRNTLKMLPKDPLGAIKDDDEAIDSFAHFIARYSLTDGKLCKTRQAKWRTICRELAGRDDDRPGHLMLSSTEIMITMTRHATKLPELTALVLLVPRPYKVKNQQALYNSPAAIVRPLDISQVQSCVQWALANKTSLAILGGGHSDHCLWPNVVSVKMGAFDKVYVVNTPQNTDTDSWVVAEAGCKTGDIIKEIMPAGVTVPLGSRPSVGAGLWLQGGIGHLARHYGLACDAIIGAVMVDAASGQVLCIGHVPEQHRPPNAIRHEHDEELLWALKGAGTNFGIVISVTFKSYTSQTFSVRNYGQPNGYNAEETLANVSRDVSSQYHHGISSDCEGGQMRCGMATFLCSLEGVSHDSSKGLLLETVDAIELFDKEMYISKMHGGHGGGKTSAFKRCVFLKDMANTGAIKVLIPATKDGPTPYCYFHLAHGGKAVRNTAPEDTAFGCIDWDFACVVTGVWPREYDGTRISDAVIHWVYRVVNELLPMSKGVYGADLGPDPRDSNLATKAFGPNRRRLVKLKKELDPKNILAYTCPLILIGLP
ncbi:FAD-linked oxidoreductase [Fusarium oxysporum f. sp. cubense]|uniref:FAD-linked oxidoreductase n=1 Tax=Fusarium oxysporum f. sp. cubense TaxID=61366 RepID=A0A559L681_FUSOC|nr:FAD-linked oxidoreductase [Fusarium oxysporum f. sp. cubense]